jgi:hypothetical protein
MNCIKLTVILTCWLVRFFLKFLIYWRLSFIPCVIWSHWK